MTRDIVTWGSVRKLPLRANRFNGGVGTLGEYLDVLGLDKPHGRKEVTDFDKNKIMHLMLRDNIDLKRGVIDMGLERGAFELIEDIARKLNKYLNVRGLLARPVTFMVDSGGSYLEEKTLEELKVLRNYGLYSIRLNLKGKKHGKYEINLDYVLDLGLEEKPYTKLVVDFIKSKVWYLDYLEGFLDNICLHLQSPLANFDALTYCINNRYIEDSAVEGSNAQVIMEVVEDVESIERVLSYR